MKITMNEIPVREVAEKFFDDPEQGCQGYGGKLNIRPAFQREFVYNETQRNEVVNTVMKNFPLNVMYWVRSGDGNFEMLDGQQRTISICQYVTGGFSMGYKSFGSLTDTERAQILDYKLMIYICEGTDKEKLDWFNIINIAGEKLTHQEALNAIYACEWLTDAKKYFSKNGCPAYSLYGKYLNGRANRQDYLETALKWISDRDSLISHVIYMDAQKHNHTPDALELWKYFEAVFAWVQKIFPKHREKLMKGLQWGFFYNRYGDKNFDAAELEEKISRLIKDKEVTNNRGIYEYLLSGDERHLSLRSFDDDQKFEAYERQGGKCVRCGKKFEFKQMEGDHITPWSKGGKTVSENCQMLCKSCNRRKSNI
ncbi:MAG: HNH endonuclease [Selenomonadaceae bacterium]|nr:HNH endonuclease [Selenomonadaceae bacterium]